MSIFSARKLAAATLIAGVKTFAVGAAFTLPTAVGRAYPNGGAHAALNRFQLETVTQLRMTANLEAAPTLLGTLALGAWTKYGALAMAAATCAYVAVRGPKRRWGLALGGVSPALNLIATWWDPAVYGPAIIASMSGFVFALTIESIHRIRSTPAAGAQVPAIEQAA
jgi:hypothetical protein